MKTFNCSLLRQRRPGVAGRLTLLRSDEKHEENLILADGGSIYTTIGLELRHNRPLVAPRGFSGVTLALTTRRGLNPPRSLARLSSVKVLKRSIVKES